MAELPTFKCGDVVAIHSGGPPMTVSIPDRGDGLAECMWFTGGILRRDAFDRAELKLCVEPGRG